MSEFVTSADGTRIAFDRRGEGPAVILVSSAFNFRAFDPATTALADRLSAEGFTVVDYDRRGRGESTDMSETFAVGADGTDTAPEPYEIEREIEDLAALVEAVGGEAALFGSSSGAALCLWAAGAGIGVTAAALWEIPLDLPPDGGESAGAASGGGAGAAGGARGEWLAGLRARLAAGDREGTVEYYMKDMPPEWLAGAKNSPGWPVMVQNAPTLEYDAAVLERADRAPWSELFASVTMPVLVLHGTETLPIFPPVAAALVEALPDARTVVVEGAHHGFAPAVMAAELATFFRAVARAA